MYGKGEIKARYTFAYCLKKTKKTDKEDKPETNENVENEWVQLLWAYLFIHFDFWTMKMFCILNQQKCKKQTLILNTNSHKLT